MAQEIKAADVTAADTPIDTTTNPPADDGSASEPAAPADNVPADIPADESAKTQEEPPMKAAQAVPQSPETATHNNGPAPVGRVIVQKSITELENELDSGALNSIEDFVKKHWDDQDASVLRLAQVLRMETAEVWDIIKRLGVQLPQGM